MGRAALRCVCEGEGADAVGFSCTAPPGGHFSHPTPSLLAPPLGAWRGEGAAGVVAKPPVVEAAPRAPYTFSSAALGRVRVARGRAPSAAPSKADPAVSETDNWRRVATLLMYPDNLGC